MTSPTDARSAIQTLERLSAARVQVADAASAAQLIADAARVQSYLDSFVANVSARIDALHRAGKSADAQSIVRRHANVTRRDAQKAHRRSQAIAHTPALGEALATGSVGAAHIDAFANAADKLPPMRRQQLLDAAPELLDVAATQSVERFAATVNREVELLDEQSTVDRFVAQQRATKLTKWIDPHDGMYKIAASLDPVTGARVFKMIDLELESLWRAEHPRYGDEPLPTSSAAFQNLAAHALAGVCTRGALTAPSDTEGVCGGARRGPVELMVLVDLDTITAGLHRHSVCELGDGTGISTATARRLACDAEVVPIILDGDGVVLDVGRAKRTATRTQRRALRVMYPSCAIDGCGTAFDQCQIHHVVPWHRGGHTDLTNLIPLCHRHHHLAHEGRWQFNLDRKRQLTITRPDGTIHQTCQLPSAEPSRQRRRTRHHVRRRKPAYN